jgi:hypothetical protein
MAYAHNLMSSNIEFKHMESTWNKEFLNFTFYGNKCNQCKKSMIFYSIYMLLKLV